MEFMPTPESGGPVPPPPEPGLTERLTEVERQLAALDTRLARVEATLGPTVAHEVKGATSELARAITELGRRLALDLPHELRRHRDVIVSELRPPPPPPPPPPPLPPEVDDEALEADDDPEPEADPQATGDRRRVPRRRRRHGE